MRRLVWHYAKWRGFGYGCTPYEAVTACGRDTTQVEVTRMPDDVTCARCLQSLRKRERVAAEVARA